MGRHIRKNVSSKYNQKLLDHVTLSATNAFKTSSKRLIQKIAEATGDIIGNETADKITRVSKTSPPNSFETNKEIFREKNISPELRQKFIDDLRLRVD